MFAKLFKSKKRHEVASKAEILSLAEARVARGNIRAQWGHVLKAKDVDLRKRAILSEPI